MSSIRYTFGSLDNPTPKVVSLFKSSYPSGRSYGAELKHDILSTLQFINEQRSIWIKMNRAAMRMAVTMSVASTDEVLTLYSRWIEVGLKCNIQQIKRISLRYNSELQRSYKHGIVDDSNIKRKMMRPEHFERGLPHNIRKQKQSQGSLVNKQRGVVSPWEGSEFKYELLCSLRTKLLKKVVLSAFKCYARMCQNNRQCISSSTRSKLKRLMQLCFSSIMLEALSAKYIVFASNFAARKLLARKYLRPALSRLQLQVVNAQRYRALSKRSDPLYRRNMRRVGFRLLQWNVRYLESHRLLVKWAAKHTTQHSTLRAFTAWVASFIKKTRLREQIHARFSGNDENNVLQMEDQLKTPGRLSTTGYNTTFGANRSSATPLNATLTSLHPSAVLDQSPLANLRAAVSFYVDHSSRAGDGSGVSAVSFMSSSAAGKKGNMGESDSNVVTTDPGAFLGRSCQNTLNTHTRRSLRELRVAQLEAEAFRALNGSTVSRRSSSSGIGGDCGETSGPLHRDGNRSYLRTPSCSLHRTENHEEGFPGTQEGLLQAEVRMQLQSSLRARSLFPQPRFVAPISPGCADDGGSSESSGVNGSSRHRSNVWKNRHASRDGGHSDYVLNSAEESPEFSLSSDALSEQENEEFSSIEDLLLNVSTTTSSRISGNQAAARTSSGSARRAETSLLDKAIHESFVLSSPSYTYAAERDSDSLQGSPTMSTSALNGRQQGGDRRVGGGAGGSAAAPSSSSSAVPSAEAYFKRVASSGGFCGQVEVDSDLDMTISESSKHLSRNDGRGSRGAGGNTGHQRMLVHKQFVEQIQGAFQMIKVFQFIV